jgi:chorismate mutase / prephenate dehydratase
MTEQARIAYLGPPGTFTHVAAQHAFGADARLVETSTIAGVFERVLAGEAELGVVPIENSTEGSVAPTLDGLLEHDLSIQREIVLEIEHCLVARQRDLSGLRRIASHPQALAQCRRWLADQMPDAELVPLASTSAAARTAATDPSTAAIASRLAASLLGLELVAEGIQDQAGNATRFVVVGRGAPASTGHDRTSIAFSLPHQRGALLGALAAFDRADINLTRIESRPLPGQRWEYRFFADFEGHRAEPRVAAALAELSDRCGTLAVLGSYPRAF